jgi:hypothetical protein
MNKIIFLPLTLALSASLPAGTTAYWRLEEGVVGNGIDAALDSSVNGLNQNGKGGSPTYSSNVPGAFIYDPVTSATVANTLSMSSLAANSRIHTANSEVLNTSFTFEMFIQIKGEPQAYHNYANRIGANTDKWQIDFDHGAKGSFGRPRVRMDTPEGDNTNYTTGQAGWNNLPSDRRIWVDSAEAYDGASPPVYGDAADWSSVGDGINDNLAWRHLAMTFNQDSQEVSLYLDYELAASRTLVDSDDSGYVHPDAGIRFGKTGGGEYEMYVDEGRYSDNVLTPNQFLRAVNVPEPSTTALWFLGGALLLRRRR